jgi:uncharacterized protein YdeI (YjbR/CyaY-like superfamily)
MTATRGTDTAGTAGTAGRRASRDAAPAAAEPVRSFATPRAWSAWIEAHPESRGLWVKFAKKGSKSASITYAEALDVALAWGWIDGQKKKLDDAWWLQRFCPRRPKSIWSKINCGKADALLAAGEMTPRGVAEVERAKSDGRWAAAYESQSRSSVPPDLAVALKANPRAARFFETLESYNRYAILFRIHTAKKPETRVARIEKFVAMLSRHEKLHRRLDPQLHP